jgi:GDP-L-fucose synthase
VWGSGKPLRQFIYSHDLGKLILWALFEQRDNEAIIFCPDEADEISTGEVAKYVAEAAGFEGNLIVGLDLAW